MEITRKMDDKVNELNKEELKKRIEALKNALKRLHEGADPKEVKGEIKEILKGLRPWEIPVVEQGLVREGVGPEEIVALCDAHVELFKDALRGPEELKDVPAGHPLRGLLDENEEIVKDAENLMLYARALLSGGDEENLRKYVNALSELTRKLFGVRTHYVKLQMLLYPYLERRGLTAVPRVLWVKEDQVLARVKLLAKRLGEGAPRGELARIATDLANALIDMVYRENNILLPTAKALLSEGEWAAIALEAPSLGRYGKQGEAEERVEWVPKEPPKWPYELSKEDMISEEALSTLPKEVRAVIAEADTYTPVSEGAVKLSEGYLTREEVDAMLRTLPIDISFIDSNDRLKYWSAGKERIFPRTKTVIGRKVDYCHPPKSVHVVRRLIEEFKQGKRNSAEFWIRIGGKLIYIRYYPVRDEQGNYLGTLEVVQDVTRIKELEGEKRLLD